jgi:tripartite-type tricarboxylate transporter receptor subunit TctC
VSSWNALAAPKGTPPEVVSRLNRHVNKALQMQHVRDQLLNLGVEARGSTARELSELLASETERWKVVIQRLGLEQ